MSLLQLTSAPPGLKYGGAAGLLVLAWLLRLVPLGPWYLTIIEILLVCLWVAVVYELLREFSDTRGLRYLWLLLGVAGGVALSLLIKTVWGGTLAAIIVLILGLVVLNRFVEDFPRMRPPLLGLFLIGSLVLPWV
ncbi:MAG: hypothetical protein KKC37_03945, partial [Proteobacteria bacterium]|nr:hypothetical protein [Pseudomonadota bacterium]